MECAIGDSDKGARLLIVSVLAITLKEGEGRDEVSLLQEVVGIWQLQFVLLLNGGGMVSTGDGNLTCLAWTFGAIALLRLMAETGLAIILTDLNLNL